MRNRMKWINTSTFLLFLLTLQPKILSSWVMLGVTWRVHFRFLPVEGLSAGSPSKTDSVVPHVGPNIPETICTESAVTYINRCRASSPSGVDLPYLCARCAFVQQPSINSPSARTRCLFSGLTSSTWLRKHFDSETNKCSFLFKWKQMQERTKRSTSIRFTLLPHPVYFRFDVGRCTCASHRLHWTVSP